MLAVVQYSLPGRQPCLEVCGVLGVSRFTFDHERVNSENNEDIEGQGDIPEMISARM